MLRSKYAIQTPNRALYNSRQLALCSQDGKENNEDHQANSRLGAVGESLVQTFC